MGTIAMMGNLVSRPFHLLKYPDSRWALLFAPGPRNSNLQDEVMVQKFTCYLIIAGKGGLVRAKDTGLREKECTTGCNGL